MKIGAWLSLGFVAFAAWSCRDATQGAAPGVAPTSAKHTLGASFESQRSAARNTDPRAERACDLLQREPARRKAACCGGALASHGFDDCARRLSRSLARGAADIDERALEACALSSEARYAGCDWVTPSQPLPPAACQALIAGKLRAGAVCHSSLECVSPLHCKGVTPSEPGHCAFPEPPGADCHTSSDALAAALMLVDVDAAHPPCAGTCSAVSRRCEAAREPRASTPAPETRSAAAGEACTNDFDCAAGGCVGEPKHCGMKCAISFAHAAAPPQPPLVLPRRTSLARVITEAR